MVTARSILSMLEKGMFKYRVWFPRYELHPNTRYSKETTADTNLKALTNLVYSLKEIYYGKQLYRSKAEKSVLLEILKANKDWDYILV